MQSHDKGLDWGLTGLNTGSRCQALIGPDGEEPRFYQRLDFRSERSGPFRHLSGIFDTVSTIRHMQSLRSSVIAPLLTCDAVAKAQGTLALSTELLADAQASIEPPTGIPGRPNRPYLVPPTDIKHLSLVTIKGRAALIHSIAHIELNAIDLALDIVWRFSRMPDQFYRDWVSIAKEEALHFSLLRDHLLTMGFDYGDFPAHNSLWEMAERTKHDVLARVALVPRTLEARGLDASPAVKNKLVSVGDKKAGEILDVILQDEIGHVAAGNYWYRWICAERQLDPIKTYADLVNQYDAPKLRPPFNMEARRLAGFDEVELHALAGQTNHWPCATHRNSSNGIIDT